MPSYTTVPIKVMEWDEGAALVLSLELNVAVLACAAVDRWGRAHQPLPFLPALADAFLEDARRQPWLAAWWGLYRSIADRHLAQRIG